MNAGIGRISALGANRTRRDGGNDVNDPQRPRRAIVYETAQLHRTPWRRGGVVAARGACAARAYAGDRNMDGAPERCGRTTACGGVPRSVADRWLDGGPKYPH